MDCARVHGADARGVRAAVRKLTALETKVERGECQRRVFALAEAVPVPADIDMNQEEENIPS